MKKLLIFILAFLVLVGGVYAAEPTVTIEPANPAEYDDLTCLVDGQIQEQFTYSWSIGNNIIGSNYQLSHTLTSVGDEIMCGVYVSTPYGPIPYGFATTTILENQAPVVDLLEEASIKIEIKSRPLSRVTFLD